MRALVVGLTEMRIGVKFHSDICESNLVGLNRTFS